MSQTRLPIRFEWHGPAPAAYPDRVLVPISTPGIDGAAGEAPPRKFAVPLSAAGTVAFTWASGPFVLATLVTAIGTGTGLLLGSVAVNEVDIPGLSQDYLEFEAGNPREYTPVDEAFEPTTFTIDDGDLVTVTAVGNGANYSFGFSE